jgi:hypothetical protein
VKIRERKKEKDRERKQRDSGVNKQENDFV